MPKVFNKGQKITIIEYGENCPSFPLWEEVKHKLYSLAKDWELVA